MTKYSLIKKCPITGYNRPIVYLDLGDMPIVNNLHDTREESLSCEKYPLKLQFFEESNLSALTHVIPGDILFSNYLFKTSVNIPYINHCKDMFKHINEIKSLSENDLVVDIGGNDGTLLSTFNEVANVNLEYLNIDPSTNLAPLAEAKNIKTLVEFFNRDTYKNVYKKASVVTSTNVFQHLEDINGFAIGVANLLEDGGIWVLEFPYWTHDLQTNQFDQMYHEHVYYYTVTALHKLMIKHGLKIISITNQNIHGGTLRLIMAKNESKYREDISLGSYLISEKPYDSDFYVKWGYYTEKYVESLRDFILDLKKSGKNIAGFGAAAKGCVFLNSLNITDEVIDFVIDDTDIKHGKYIPGTGIQVVNREYINDKKIDYIIILSHNFADYIIDSFRKTNPSWNGKFIVFLPKMRII